MHKHISYLREIAKFVSGIVAADILFGLWVLSVGAYPFSFLGVVLEPSGIYSWLAIDFILLIFLIHYAWHITLPVTHPRKSLLTGAGTIFFIVALLHFLRLAFNIPIFISGFEIPYWPNLVGLVIAGFLSWTSFTFAFHKGNRS
jgi:hypothetical protein